MIRNQFNCQTIRLGLYIILQSIMFVGCRLEYNVASTQNPTITVTNSSQETQHEFITETTEAIFSITPLPQFTPSIIPLTSTPAHATLEADVGEPLETTPIPDFQIERIFDFGAERFFDFRGDRLRVSPDSQYIAVITVNQGEEINLYDYETGQKLFLLQKAIDPFVETFTSMTFSSDSKRLAVSGTGHNVWVWDVASGDLIQQFLFWGPVSNLAFSPSGQFLAAVSPSENPNEYGIGVFNIESGSLIAQMRETEATSVLFLNESQLLIGAATHYHPDSDTSEVLFIWNYEKNTMFNVLSQVGLVQLMATNAEKTKVALVLENNLRMIKLQDLIEIDVEEPEVEARTLSFDGTGQLWVLEYDGTLLQRDAEGKLIRQQRFDGATDFVIIPETNHLLISFPEEIWEVAFQ